MKFSVIATALASVAFAADPVTQIGDGQVQAPTGGSQQPMPTGTDMPPAGGQSMPPGGGESMPAGSSMPGGPMSSMPGAGGQSTMDTQMPMPTDNGSGCDQPGPVSSNPLPSGTDMNPGGGGVVPTGMSTGMSTGVMPSGGTNPSQTGGEGNNPTSPPTAGAGRVAGGAVAAIAVAVAMI